MIETVDIREAGESSAAPLPKLAALVPTGRSLLLLLEGRLVAMKILALGPANPLAIFAEGFGSLDWDFTIEIDTSGGTPQWTLTGRHDGFPAYEIYLNDTEIYRYSPGSPPYEFLTHVRKLLGRKDVNVGNLSGSLP